MAAKLGDKYSTRWQLPLFANIIRMARKPNKMVVAAINDDEGVTANNKDVLIRLLPGQLGEK